MLIVVTSPRAVNLPGIEREAATSLQAIAQAGHPVGIVSNHEKPPWFDPLYAGTGVDFVQVRGRQNGGVLGEIAKKANVAPHDILVLAASLEDMQMGKNGDAVLMGAGWSNVPQISRLGILITSMGDLVEMVRLTASWPGSWWFSGQQGWYSVKALSDLSTYNKGIPQVEFAERVTATVKQGGPRLMALLTIAARSLLMDGAAKEQHLAFGVYPSSSSANDDDEVLSDFCHRLRTTVSQVHFAARGKPLFIRHRPSPKRSHGGGGDRTDPSEQLETLHINPEYRGKLSGRHVVVVDDCATYGVSFGVAAALLRAAGAKKITGIALGKFGGKLRYYEIAITSDPYAPIPTNGYTIAKNEAFDGIANLPAQGTLVSLLG